ncbi:MAG: hypothetical protein JNM17_30495 [Archangium sp.]|nr:hypothetical protein [Archangium sp.]
MSRSPFSRTSFLIAFVVALGALADGGTKDVTQATDAEDAKAPWNNIGAQKQLIAAADDIADFLGLVAPYASVPPDFGALEIDRPGNKVLLYWKAGTAFPTSLDDQIRAVESAYEINVDVLPSPLSMRDLLQARTTLWNALIDTPARSITLKRGASALVVGGPSSAVSSLSAHTAVLSVRTALENLQSTTTNDPVEVVEDEPYQFASRVSDSAPWWGGAQVGPTGTISGISGLCTSGFAVANFGGAAMLTPFHCFPSSGGSVTNGVPQVPMGLSFVFNANTGPAFDVARINVASNAGRLYDGEFGNEFFRDVKGRGTNFPGMLVCSSGGLSGTRCDVEVDSVGGVFTDQLTGQRVSSVVMAHQLAGEAAAGTGDSGAPVFTLQMDLVGVKARGMTIAVGAGATVATCAGVGGRLCSSSVVFVDIDTGLSTSDTWLVVH